MIFFPQLLVFVHCGANTAPDPYGTSCELWAYRRMGQRSFFGLCLVRPHGLRSSHQAFILPRPTQGGGPVTLSQEG